MIFPVEDILAEAPAATPLYAAAASSSTANVWSSINGWSVARVYGTVEAEYEQAKSEAVLVDLGALARYSVRGGEAGAFLSRLTTAPTPRLEAGESARGLMLMDNGGVIDLAEVSRLSDELFLLTTPMRHPRRLKLAARGMNVVIEDIASDVGAIGVLGPASSEILASAGLKGAAQRRAATGSLRGVETAARPVQFGSVAGVELIFPKEEALTVWERLIRRGGVAPIGLDALEILRLESGAPRTGLDYTPADHMRPEATRTPDEIGLPHLAPLDKGWFNGRQALRNNPRPSGRRLVAMSIDADHLSPGAGVFAGDKPLGRVTSCAWSPSNKRVIAQVDITTARVGKSFEISMVSTEGARASAQIFETLESKAAAAYYASMR